MKKNYTYNFYKDRHQKTIYSANTILSMVIDAIPEVHSAVDFGCGVGTWLSVLKKKGVREIQGIDGPWVKQDILEIPRQNFQQADFEKGIKLNKRYDLAISLEVAEHLPNEVAKTFVESLVNASDFILFSAAIPFQGGKNHINEQWPDYWATLFNERGYVVLDFIRRKIWGEKNIPVWYRQNILMFVKQKQMINVKISGLDLYNKNLPIALVHPDTYISKVSTVKGSLKSFLRSVKKWAKLCLTIH